MLSTNDCWCLIQVLHGYCKYNTVIYIKPSARMRRRVTVVGYVSGPIFSYSNKSAKKTYRSSQRCNRLIKNMFYSRKTASSQSCRICIETILAHLSAILLPSSAHERIFNHVTLLSNTWCCSCQLCHCVCESLYSACAYLTGH